MQTKNSQNILLCNDMPCHGMVAMNVVAPVLSAMGYSVYRLPTALFSNTLNYGCVAALDTTEYMQQALHAWSELGVSFKGVCTGYLHAPRQALVLEDMLRSQAPDFVLVDPVMADGGAFYKGLGEETACALRRLARFASVVTPNVTEAALLTKQPQCMRGPLSDAQLRGLLDEMLGLGAQAAVITGCAVAGEALRYVYGRSQKGNAFRIAYHPNEIRRFGTGDAFGAVLAGCMMRGQPLQESAQAAVQCLSKLFDAAQGLPPCEDGFSLQALTGLMP